MFPYTVGRTFPEHTDGCDRRRQAAPLRSWRDRLFAGWPSRWPDPFRAAVLTSRVPAIVATLVGLVGALTALQPALSAALGPGVLLVCLALWVRADLLLFAPASPSDPKDTDR